MPVRISKRPVLIISQFPAMNLDQLIGQWWFEGRFQQCGCRGLHPGRIDHQPAAPGQRRQVHLDRHAVQADGLLDGFHRNRQQTPLRGEADQHQVGAHAVTNQRLGQVAAGRGRHALFRHDRGQARHQQVGLRARIRIPGKMRQRFDPGIRNHPGRGRIQGLQGFIADAAEQIAGNQQIGGRLADLARMIADFADADREIAGHCPVLLAKTGLVEAERVFALQPGGNGQHRADRDDPGATDAGNQDTRGVARKYPGCRQNAVGKGHLCFLRRLQRVLTIETLEHHETRAETILAGKILVTAGLVDFPLGAKNSVPRFDRDAVAGKAAIATALANPVVDDHSLRRIRKLGFLAPPTLFRGAGLDVDQHRGAGHLAQLALDLVELAPVPDFEPLRPGRLLMVLRAVADDLDAGNALADELLRDVPGAMIAVDALPTGERNRIVVEQLEGDVDTAADRAADGETAGVVIGTVAQVHEGVLDRAERRAPDPVLPFPAHLAHPGVVLGIHQRADRMAADAAGRDRPIGHLGRGIVRAAGAIPRDTLLRLSARQGHLVIGRIESVNL